MKTPKKKVVRDYRSSYMLHLELGLLIALVIFLFAFKINYYPGKEVVMTDQPRETVQIEDVVRTKQTTPPSLPKPVVPVEMPNDEVFEEEVLDFSTEIDLGQALEVPDAPPSEPGTTDKEKAEEEQIFIIVEKMPELVEGYSKLQERIRYPEMARKAGIEGLVVVQFVIDTKGNVINPTIVRGIGGGCDQEALRVVKSAKFRPGLQQGRPVKVHYTLPIRFTLKENR